MKQEDKTELIQEIYNSFVNGQKKQCFQQLKSFIKNSGSINEVLEFIPESHREPFYKSMLIRLLNEINED